MKKLLLVAIVICGAYIADAQSIQTNIERIQSELDKILIEANSLPAYKRSAISASIINIKQMLGSNAPDPRNTGRHPQEGTMINQEFDGFLLVIKQTSPFDTQLMQISRRARSTRFYMDQIHDILKLFNFSSERDKVRDILLPRAIDPENVRLLYDMYPFSSEQKKLDEILYQLPN
ncbi:DUF4476 domain-containing protein [uncultured Acetobacteroides sp.]|uniref:DUF4476 domain-containing protein n=1 Tax=uncultured Acetobacteroides sp. TaxID=1760811 RepID=UPI0029F4A467|nr:DUF4476 domain-containing protein [uncultured Acetobacteroides sp.]